MRALRAALAVVAIVVIVVFSLSNRQAVSVALWPVDATLDAPLSLVVLAVSAVFFLGGALLGAVPATNQPTAQTSFAPAALALALNQTFGIATQGIPVGDEKDPEWPVCLACAVADRARARKGVSRSGACVGCLQRYCAS